MAEAAKAAGVSAAAPYRHFEGRDALIAEIALQGFNIFADLMEFAYTKGQGSAIAAFGKTGQAYQAFAAKYPGHYICMFESGLSINSSVELSDAANRAFASLTNACEEMLQVLPKDKRPPTVMVSQHIWAMSHGVVELFARGEPGARSPFTPEEIIESGIGVYLRGLGVLPKDS